MQFYQFKLYNSWKFKNEKISLLGAHSLLIGDTGIKETWAGVQAKKIK